MFSRGADADKAVADSSCGDGSFSMRDYVLAARKKDIGHNWPFPPKYLQMCLGHGISKVLPPFEPRGLPKYPFHEGVTGLDPSQEEKVCAGPIQNCCVSINGREESDEFENGTCMEEAITNVSEQVCLLSLSDGTNEQKKDKYLTDDATKYETCAFGNKMKEIPQSVVHHELLRANSLHHDSRYKTLDAPEKVVCSMQNMKETIPTHGSVTFDNELGSGLEFDSIVVDLNSNSDLCPFNSKTLSTSPPSIKRVGHKTKRRRGKPKKRSIVDICARAKPLTLEDLDRINGSSWAVDSSLMPYGCSGCKETKYVVEARSQNLALAEEPKLQDSSLVKKHPREDNLRDNHKSGKKRRIMVNKLKRSISKLRKRKLSSFICNDSEKGG